MNIQHKHRHNNRTRDENHREEQVFADERRRQRRGRIDLGDQQQEDVERVEDGDAHCYLLTGVRRNVEYEQSHRTNSHTGQDEIDRVEKCFSSDSDVELDVRIRFCAARVMLVSLLCFDCQQIPFRALVIVVKADA